MRRLLVMLILSMSCGGTSLAADAIILRATAEPTVAWVGQQTILRIDVLGADGWAQISQFPEMQLPGAYTIRTGNQGTRLQETIDGVAYTGQRYEVSVYPQKAGLIPVPPLPLEVSIKTWGADASQTVQQKRTPGLTIDARLPPGAEGIRDLISTSGFTATQQWSPESASPRVGDALKRTITRQAEDVSGMALAPLAYPDLTGVGIYPAEPEVADKADRGSLSGRRTDTVTYVFERAGAVRIPDIALTWWNVPASLLETETLAGRELEVLSGPASGSGSATAQTRVTDGRSLWLPITILFSGAILLWRFAPDLAERWSTWRLRLQESEARHFKQALRSIRSKDARRALRHIMRWLDHINDGEAPAQLQAFVRRYGNGQGDAAVERLLHSSAAGDPLGNAADLVVLLQQVRNSWRQANRQVRELSKVLPELNGAS